jgi:hypothetical protein
MALFMNRFLQKDVMKRQLVRGEVGKRPLSSPSYGGFMRWLWEHTAIIRAD